MVVEPSGGTKLAAPASGEERKSQVVVVRGLVVEPARAR